MRHLAFTWAVLFSLTAFADEPKPAAEPAASEPAPPAAVEPPPPNAGYQGSFFLRDSNDWFVLFPKGRLQVDGYFFPARGDLPPGVVANSTDDRRPKSTIFVRRARAELQGTFARHFDFSLAGEFATVPALGAYAIITDCYVIVNYTPYAQLQIGQFDVPFTQENRTSDKAIDFMERSLAVRAFGVPGNKDIGAMVFGTLPGKVAYYSVGVFDGEGQNIRNQDNFFAVIGRAFVAPLAPWAKGRRWMEELEVGGSGWWQHVDSIGLASGVGTSITGGTLNDVLGMSTQGGWSFFSSSYKDGSVFSHLVPHGTIGKWAVEAHLPLGKVGLKWEYVHQSLDVSRYDDVSGQPRIEAGRGNLSGYGTYLELYAWILGDRTMIEAPGLEAHPRLDFKRKLVEPAWGLMAAAKYEHLSFDLGLPPGATVNGMATVDPGQGNYAVDVVELGLNAWLTKHVRFTANYVANRVDGDSANVKRNFYYRQWEHELLLRAAIGL